MTAVTPKAFEGADPFVVGAMAREMVESAFGLDRFSKAS